MVNGKATTTLPHNQHRIISIINYLYIIGKNYD